MMKKGREKLLKEAPGMIEWLDVACRDGRITKEKRDKLKKDLQDAINGAEKERETLQDD